jgi:hypothetical protein
MWKRDLHALHAAALPQIEMIERARANANQGIARPRNGIVGILVTKDLRPSVRVKTNGSHSISNQPGNQQLQGISEISRQCLIGAEAQLRQ